MSVSQNFHNNRMHMLKHPSQRSYVKALCICSGGILRSPTAAWVLSNSPYFFNTRAAGIVPKYALIQVDEYLVAWADIIICMDKKHERLLRKNFEVSGKEVVCLNISDDFVYRDEKLIELIKTKYAEATSNESSL